MGAEEFVRIKDEFTIVDLSIQLAEYDLELGSAEVMFSYQSVEARIYIKRNEEEEIIRQQIHDRFKLLLGDDSYIAGIYNERQGPVYPLDVLIRLPRAFIGQVYYLYVIKQSSRLSDILSGVLIPRPPSSISIDQILNVKMENNRSEFDSQSKLLSMIFRKYGYIKCELPDHIWKEYSKAKKLINEFFDLPTETKLKYRSGNIGYIPKSRREIFHIHESLFHSKNAFPDCEISEFSDLMNSIFHYFRDITIAILLNLTIPLGYPKDYVLSLIDKSEDFWLYATSLRLFRYNPVSSDAKWTHKLQCEEHADTALLTLSPCTIPSEVEIVDRASGMWQEAEKGAKENEVLIFVGVYLAWLTGGYYQAPLHRVNHVSSDVRISTPFFLRSPKDAPLKREYLNSELLPNVQRSEQTVGSFVKSRESYLPHITNELKPFDPNNYE